MSEERSTGNDTPMKMLSVAEASKSLSDCVNRVYARRESFAIVKLGVPRALLVPAMPPPGCNSHELADDLAKAELPADDRRGYEGAVRKGRKSLKPLKNPWG